LDAAYRAYLSAALRAPDRRTFTLESQVFLAQLRNGHTIFMDRGLMGTPEGEPVGFSLQQIDGQWAVATSEISELRPGDVVTAIDGTPFETFYRDARRYLPASTEAWVRRVLFEDIPGFYSGGLYFPFRFTLSLADGRDVIVDRQALPPRSPAPETEGRWLRDGTVAYVRVPSFKEPRFENEAVALVDQFLSAETIIVDVRGNTGGSTPTRLHEALMDRPYRWWAGSTPMAPALHQSYAEGGNGWYGDFRRPHLAWPARTHQPGKDPFRGRVVILTDAGCNSACEDFVMPFKDNGRATLVGETTAGSTGQPYMLDLGSDLMAIIGAKRERFPDGSVFEGVGIQPDVAVVPRIDDLRAGQDPVLERAITIVDEGR
jgi:carboxyl-terminal processing protease